jgi:hypothetical protein
MDWERRKHNIAKVPVLRDVSEIEFIQAISLLATQSRRDAAIARGDEADRLPAVSCRRRDMLRLEYVEYREWAPRVEHGFVRAAKFLHRQHIYDSRFLPYSTQLVPLVAVLTRLGKAADEAPVFEKLSRWYWSGVFGELYGSTTETRFARDMMELPAWIDGGPEPRTIVEATFAPDRLLTLRTRRSAAYRGIYCLLLRAGASDFLTGEKSDHVTYFDEQVDIHHIFPQAWCGKNGIPASRYDCIINKAPLTAGTNRSIGGVAPSEYLGRLHRNKGVERWRLDAHVSSHLVDPSTMWRDDFDGFFASRRASILGAISAAMGKSLESAEGPDTAEAQSAPGSLGDWLQVAS